MSNPYHARFVSRLHLHTLEDRSVPSAAIEEPVKIDPPAEPTDPTDPIVQTMTVAPVPVPDVMTAKRFAVGSGPGQTGLINVYSTRTNALLTSLTPFGASYTGGVRVATADFNGDGIDDVAAVGATGTPHVVVVDGVSGKTFSMLTPWSKATGGAFIAAGDINGDGRPDLVVGSGVGQTPTIAVYSGASLTGTNPTPIRTFAAANSDAAFGVRVAVGDLDGDGLAEIVTGSKNSVTIQQTQFGNVRTEANRRGAVGRFSSAPVLVRGIPVAADTAGVFVAVGDFTGSGKADIAAGYVANGTARVRVVSGQNTGRMLMTSFGFTSAPQGGVPVAFRDITGTGKQALIAAGGQGTSQVRILNPTVGGIARSFMSMTPSYTGGVFVG